MWSCECDDTIEGSWRHYTVCFGYPEPTPPAPGWVITQWHGDPDLGDFNDYMWWPKGTWSDPRLAVHDTFEQFVDWEALENGDEYIGEMDSNLVWLPPEVLTYAALRGDGSWEYSELLAQPWEYSELLAQPGVREACDAVRRGERT